MNNVEFIITNLSYLKICRLEKYTADSTKYLEKVFNEFQCISNNIEEHRKILLEHTCRKRKLHITKCTIEYPNIQYIRKR